MGNWGLEFQATFPLVPVRNSDGIFLPAVQGRYMKAVPSCEVQLCQNNLTLAALFLTAACTPTQPCFLGWSVTHLC